MENHLRPVPAEDQPAESPTKARRRSSRPRTTKALPTDRLKFSAQVDALKAFAIESGFGKQAVGSEDIAPRMGVAPTTAGLNNAFFMETGLIKRERKGHYFPSDEVSQFARSHGFDPKHAGKVLGAVLKKAWPFAEVQRQLQMGPTTKDAMVSALARSVGASADHEPQLRTVLEWLEYAELITVTNGNIELLDSTPTTKPEKEQEQEAHKTPPADPKGQESTTENGRQERPTKSEPLLSFSFDFVLTAEDLKELTPEQIHAVYDAVGKLMAIKAGMKAHK
jgi:hypothetical protein